MSQGIVIPDENDFDLLALGRMGERAGAPGRDGTLRHDDDNQYGRTFVTPGAPTNYPACNTGRHEKSRMWCVTFQQTGQVAPKGFTATIITGIGEAKYTRTVQHFPPGLIAVANGPTLPPYHVIVFGQYVDVSITRVGGSVPVGLSVSISPAESSSVGDYYTYQYGSMLGAGGGAGAIDGAVLGFGATGVIASAHAVLVTLPSGGPGTPLWPMLFDATSLPVNGTTPVLTLDSLRSLGDGVSFEDSTPGGLQFSTGLFAALSTTADTLTLALTGAMIVPAVKVGN